MASEELATVGELLRGIDLGALTIAERRVHRVGRGGRSRGQAAKSLYGCRPVPKAEATDPRAPPDCAHFRACGLTAAVFISYVR
jgi:hypothetical protein